MNGNKDYSDIIHLSRPVSKKHPPMSGENRGAQFAPFAALTGYDAAIDEAKRLTSDKIVLDEHEREELDYKLQVILKELMDGEPVEVEVVYFVKDERKNGGCYVNHKGRVTKIDSYNKTIVIEDRIIYIEDIINIEGI